MFLTYNLGDVDAVCEEFNKSGYPLAMPIKTESWFERHCYVIDPNGIPLNLAHWNETPAEPKGIKDDMCRLLISAFNKRGNRTRHLAEIVCHGMREFSY